MSYIQTALFLGSKKFGLEIFKSLYSANKNVHWTVMCPPDQDDPRTYFDEFLKFAQKEDLDISVANSPDMIVQYASDHKPDVMFVCGYYRILSGKLFDLIHAGVWGIHNSLLPKYRGGSPLVWQMINGEKELGSSLFKFSEGVDDGPVLHQLKVNNTNDLTINGAMDLLENAWVDVLPEIWSKFCEGSLTPTDQDHKQATFCAQRQEYDGEVNWNESAEKLDCFIRAQAAPYPRAYFEYDNKKIRITSHELDRRTVYGTCGQVFEVREDFVSVCCGENSLLKLTGIEVNGEEVPPSKILKSFKIRL